jgi:hypothetical protein
MAFFPSIPKYAQGGPRNVLLNEDLEPTICDFGMSFHRAPPLYTAPELLRYGFDADEPNELAADVYSYGMILFELVTGKNLSEASGNAGGSADAWRQWILRGHRPAFPPGTDQSWKEFIEACWHDDPADRPIFAGMLESKELVDEFRFEGCDEREFDEYQRKVLAFMQPQ